jgi:hypothetical protein
MGKAGVSRSRLLIATLSLALAACTGASRADPEGASSSPPPGVTPAPPPSDVRQCDAASLKYLIGRPRSEIPAPIEPGNRRVYCSSCVITQDYVPGRTDIVFDTQTGIIIQVKCG